jgi:hypothetical protein
MTMVWILVRAQRGNQSKQLVKRIKTPLSSLFNKQKLSKKNKMKDRRERWNINKLTTGIVMKLP